MYVTPVAQNPPGGAPISGRLDNGRLTSLRRPVSILHPQPPSSRLWPHLHSFPAFRSPNTGLLRLTRQRSLPPSGIFLAGWLTLTPTPPAGQSLQHHSLHCWSLHWNTRYHAFNREQVGIRWMMQGTKACALWPPRGVGWGGRWQGGSTGRGHRCTSDCFLVAQTVKNLPAMLETLDRSLGQEDPLGKGMGTHSSILAWEIPWTEEPGGLQSVWSQRVRHDWSDWHLHRYIWLMHVDRGRNHHNIVVV